MTVRSSRGVRPGRTPSRWVRLLLTAMAAAGLILAISGLPWWAPTLPGDAIRSVDPQVQSLYERARAGVRASPDSAAAWAELGLVFAAQDHDEPAIACLSRATSMDGGDWTWPALEAALEARSGHPEYAVETMLEATRRDPRREWPRLARARWLESLGHAAEAEGLYRGLLAEAPDHAAAALGLARVLLATVSPDDASAVIAPALSHPATRRGAHQLLARIEGLRGNETAAQAAAAAALAMPDDPPWPTDPLPDALAAYRVGKRDLLDRILALEKAGADRQAMDASAALVTGHPEIALLLHGRQLLAQGDARRAEETFRAALARDVRSIESAHALGLAIAAQGRLDEAADVFRSVLAVEPSYIRAWEELARCLDATDPDAARDARAMGAKYAPATAPRAEP